MEQEQAKKPLKTYGYYIATKEGKILEWEEDFYTAVKHANAKAEVFHKTYYIYNCKYKKYVKACSGWRNENNYNPCRFGRWY